jgi:hypothetical protein
VIFEQMCDEFKKTNKSLPGALMPAARGSLSRRVAAGEVIGNGWLLGAYC